MATINGTSLIIVVDGTAIAHSTSATLNLERAMIDVSSKDSSGDSESIAGQKSASLDFEALVDFSPSEGDNIADLITLYQANASVSWEIASGTQGTAPKFTGSGFISSLSMDTPMEDATTFSGSITVTGAVTYTAS
jgi:predicted secreted protein